MLYLLGSLLLLNVSDVWLTHFIVELGVGREGNPFLLPLIGQPGFMIVKVAGVLFCALILWDIHRRNRKLALVSTSCFVAFYGMIVLWNTSLLLV